MKTINDSSSTIIIHKSKFICHLYCVHNIEEIREKQEQVRQKYKGATHYCYAYILENQKRCSDDKEPSGTAGIPILSVLESQHLDHVLCIVIRYFGGIKLGAGGLVRAYTNSITSCLENTVIVDLELGKIIEIEFEYNETKYIEHILEKNIIQKIFSEHIYYQITIPNSEFQRIKNLLKSHIINLKIIKTTYMKI